LKKLGIISVIVLGLAVGTFVLARGTVCTVEDTWQFISPDEVAAIDVYATACHPRYSSAASDIKHCNVVVLRPITELRPENNRYNEADIVFEVEKTSTNTQLSFGSMANYLLPGDPTLEGQKKVLVISCYQCSPGNIRKKAPSWNGHAIRYAFWDDAHPRLVIE